MMVIYGKYTQFVMVLYYGLIHHFRQIPLLMMIFSINYSCHPNVANKKSEVVACSVAITPV
jgi:ABC-type amino acid transport system permease subunit